MLGRQRFLKKFGESLSNHFSLPRELERRQGRGILDLIGCDERRKLFLRKKDGAGIFCRVFLALSLCYGVCEKNKRSLICYARSQGYFPQEPEGGRMIPGLLSELSLGCMEGSLVFVEESHRQVEDVFLEAVPVLANEDDGFFYFRDDDAVIRP
jgi:hypothetical protein